MFATCTVELVDQFKSSDVLNCFWFQRFWVDNFNRIKVQLSLYTLQPAETIRPSVSAHDLLGLVTSTAKFNSNYYCTNWSSLLCLQTKLIKYQINEIGTGWSKFFLRVKFISILFNLFLVHQVFLKIIIHSVCTQWTRTELSQSVSLSVHLLIPMTVLIKLFSFVDLKCVCIMLFRGQN